MSSLNAVQELRIAESDIKVLQLEIMELEKDRFVVEEKADNEEKNAVYWKRMAEHFESKYKSERKANRDTQKEMAKKVRFQRIRFEMVHMQLIEQRSAVARLTAEMEELKLKE
ncbi:hypothetical protein L5515_002880 [Caenorhabditis briggsae]|uniref:Uncharacterized protein n=1 Tax=Caenorhabditis briggsae TaxID=6238 RepID=A0AAE9EFJ8_CAEBR|nr:hypothetical protein L5515_002880 [Caenorhabditis briggsae]